MIPKEAIDETTSELRNQCRGATVGLTILVSPVVAFKTSRKGIPRTYFQWSNVHWSRFSHSVLGGKLPFRNDANTTIANGIRFNAHETMSTECAMIFLINSRWLSMGGRVGAGG